MPSAEWNRKLDLTAAKSKAKASAKPQAKVGGLTERQARLHQKSIAALDRWLTRLKRATTEIDKHQKIIKRYEKLRRASE